MTDEILKRFGTAPESVDKLAMDAAKAEILTGIHGISVTARPLKFPSGIARRSDIEAEFIVHNTPSRRDRLHRTIELPKPVTQDVADSVNRLLGRV